MLTTSGTDPGEGERPAPRGRIRARSQDQSAADEPGTEAVDSTRRKGRDEDERELVNPPIQLFALFLVPLTLLLVWALFFK
jgi:hypothetical protein